MSRYIEVLWEFKELTGSKITKFDKSYSSGVSFTFASRGKEFSPRSRPVAAGPPDVLLMATGAVLHFLRLRSQTFPFFTSWQPCDLASDVTLQKMLLVTCPNLLCSSEAVPRR